MGGKVTECTCPHTHKMIESDVEARQCAPVTGEIMRRCLMSIQEKNRGHATSNHNRVKEPR